MSDKKNVEDLALTILDAVGEGWNQEDLFKFCVQYVAIYCENNIAGGVGENTFMTFCSTNKTNQFAAITVESLTKEICFGLMKNGINDIKLGEIFIRKNLEEKAGEGIEDKQCKKELYRQ